jgi:hypothetical protein
MILKTILKSIPIPIEMTNYKFKNTVDWHPAHPQPCAMHPDSPGRVMSSYEEMESTGVPKEVIEKMSEAKKGEKNPSFGKSPSKETRKKQSEKLKGIPRPKVICPYCLKEGPVGIHHKYHFENCKSK